MKIFNTQAFINKSLIIHGSRYDYSSTIYIGNKEKLSIICPTHGKFVQLPSNHLAGKGCRKCANRRISQALVMSQDDFIKRSKERYGEKYDYSLVEYKTAKDKVKIICSIHGLFETIPFTHLKGHECKKCGIEKQSNQHRSSLKDILAKCKSIHGDKYDYSLIKYHDYDSKVEIICKGHGSFFQTMSNHLSGMKGCPECNQYSKSEKYISKLLKFNKIDFVPQKTFEEFKTNNGKFYRFDFFLNEKNIIIEYDGEQHFRGVPLWSKHCLKRQQERDALKDNFCKSKNITLIRINYKENITNSLLEKGIISQTLPNHPVI